MTMTLLPPDAESRAKTFERLTPETKKQILDVLRAKDAEEQADAIETMLRQSGKASEFLQHVLSKETSGDIPNNKSRNVIHTK
jgi:hypothetical protein